MGWEPRGKAGRYYYRWVRRDGKPKRIYCGRGADGLIFARLDEYERRARDVARDARRQEEEPLAAADGRWAEIWGQCRVLAAAALVSAGWYSHRGQWRPMMEPPRTRHAEAQELPAADATPTARLRAVADRANAGDPAALAEVRHVLDAHPDIWRRLGDLNTYSALFWTGQIASGDAVTRESITRSVAAWKAELLGPDPTPTERALADVAGVARLALAHAEWRASDNGVPVPVAAFRARRLDAALHRLNATLKLLAQVRMARPVGRAPAAPASAVPRLFNPTRDRKVG